MTQREFSEYFNVSLSTVKSWESNTHADPSSYLISLLEYKLRKEGLIPEQSDPEDIEPDSQVSIVKIVRCEDCIYGRDIDNTKFPERYFRDDCIICTCEEVVGDGEMIYVPDHFCSYGDRKESNHG